MKTALHLESPSALEAVKGQLTSMGCWVEVLKGRHNEVTLLVQGPSVPLTREALESLDGVASVTHSNDAPPKVQSQSGDLAFESGLPLIAGPCAIESPEVLDEIAKSLTSLGIEWIRGGAFKPRTSPYSFQGHGRQALRWLDDVRRDYGLKIVTEVMSELEVDDVAQTATWMQIGARNMQNYRLLKCVGEIGKPVLLKRGPAALIEEWLGAGEYLLSSGAPKVIFCERGIRGYGGPTRNLLDLATVVHMRQSLGQPVIVDPSHATGRRDLVVPLSKAAFASGADGVMVEVHPRPDLALSDGAQALSFSQLAELVAWLENANLT